MADINTIDQAADQIKSDAGKLHEVVHGDKTRIVAVDNNKSIKSVAKVIDEAEQALALATQSVKTDIDDVKNTLMSRGMQAIDSVKNTITSKFAALADGVTNYIAKDNPLIQKMAGDLKVNKELKVGVSATREFGIKGISETMEGKNVDGLEITNYTVHPASGTPTEVNGNKLILVPAADKVEDLIRVKDKNGNYKPYSNTIRLCSTPETKLENVLIIKLGEVPPPTGAEDLIFNFNHFRLGTASPLNANYETNPIKCGLFLSPIPNFDVYVNNYYGSNPPRTDEYGALGERGVLSGLLLKAFQEYYKTSVDAITGGFGSPDALWRSSSSFFSSPYPFTQFDLRKYSQDTNTREELHYFTPITHGDGFPITDRNIHLRYTPFTYTREDETVPTQINTLSVYVQVGVVESHIRSLTFLDVGSSTRYYLNTRLPLKNQITSLAYDIEVSSYSIAERS